MRLAFVTALLICPIASQLFKGSAVINFSAGNDAKLEVKFGDISIGNGTRLTTKQVERAPTTVKWNADPNKFYIVAMIGIHKSCKIPGINF